MRTSASCPATECSVVLHEGNRGFSLLELLVVLALAGVLVGMVIPRLTATLGAVQSSGDRADVARRLAGMAVDARLAGRSLELNKGDVPPLVLPDGWQVVMDEAFTATAQGVCSTALATVTGPAGQEQWRIHAPDCRVAE